MVVNPTLIECRAEYAIGSFLFVLRWLTAIYPIRTRRWGWDDFFSVLAWIFFTLIYAMVEYLAVVGAPIGMTQAQRELLDPATRDSMQSGAKGMFASFYFLIAEVWCQKAVLCILFLRLTKNTNMYRYVVGVCAVSIVCFLAAMITESTHCLPMHRNWQMLPDPGRECSVAMITNIVIAVGNVLADALLLVVPVMMLWDTRIKLIRKLKIGVLLSLGVFVMGMAIARCILSIGNSAMIAQSSVWVQREALVTIIAVNAPALNGLFRPKSWGKSLKSSGYYESYGTGTGGGGGGGGEGGGRSGPNNPRTATGQYNNGQSSHSGRKKGESQKLEIYSMVDIHRTSKDSVSNLVQPGQSQAQEIPDWSGRGQVLRTDIKAQQVV